MNRFQRIASAVLTLAWLASATAPAQSRTAARVDLNSASEQELEALPGVGAATAKKIIAGRPYSSVGDLSKAGVSAGTVKKISGMVTVSGGRAASSAAPVRESSTRAEPAPGRGTGAASSSSSGASSGPIDLNRASEKDLEALDGVGPATAKKIIAGRPYSSVADLAKAGVSESTIRKISPQVTVSGARSSDGSSARGGNFPRSAGSSGGTASAGPIDLNSASEKDLEALDGVGPATAKKIIAGRPYSSVADLGRAGVPAATISKISSQVTVRGGATASRDSYSPSTSSSRSGAGSAAGSSGSGTSADRTGSGGPTVAYQAPPSPGMVWVNLETKVFHRNGDRWYGRTKRGRYMTENDAMKAGYKLSKEQDEPK